MPEEKTNNIPASPADALHSVKMPELAATIPATVALQAADTLQAVPAVEQPEAVSLPEAAPAADATADSVTPTAVPSVQREGRALALGIAGWLLPGMGHLLQRMWGRALVVFFAVGILVLTGISMKGNLFTSKGNDAFDTLGYVADLGTGSFYLAARAVERDGADVSHARGDYGTRFLATAGVLNLLAALHAYEAARGRKA